MQSMSSGAQGRQQLQCVGSVVVSRLHSTSPIAVAQELVARGMQNLPTPGIKPASRASPALAGGFFTTEATREAPSYFTSYLSFKVHRANNLYYVSLQQTISYLTSFPTSNAGVLSPQCDYKILEMVNIIIRFQNAQ